MESATAVVRQPRGRVNVNGAHDPGRPRQLHSRNKQWVAGENGQRSGTSTPYHSDGERWERGGHKGGRGTRGVPRGGRAKYPNVSFRALRNGHELSGAADAEMDDAEEVVEEEEVKDPEEPVLETAEEREKFWQELVKGREVERKKAIAEGKMDDPNIPKRLEDAICVVGTCMDMCPRFERYRRERENNLFEWEVIPGTKRIDHKRAVKMYERAAGDKTLPSDLRPPEVLKRTLDYLFHDLLLRGGFSPTFNFIRDRSRAVRNDFTMQHSYGPDAIECHDRCARFHILAIHLERNRATFSVALEEQQLMNTLQSLKEFYEDQRGRYDSPTELEMRVYHRLIHIRDQRERHDDIPEHILSHPVFKLTTNFRLHVQRKSAPITKTSSLVVDAEGMGIFGNLANVLREQGNVVMIYLVACILERHFGIDAIDDIESIKGDLSIPDIIDGVSGTGGFVESYDDGEDDAMEDELGHEGEPDSLEPEPDFTSLVKPVAVPAFGQQPSMSAFGPKVPASGSAFSSIATTPNVFNTPSPFGGPAFPSSSSSVFGTTQPKSIFTVPGPSTSQPQTEVSSLPSAVPPLNRGQNIVSLLPSTNVPEITPVTPPAPSQPPNPTPSFAPSQPISFHSPAQPPFGVESSRTPVGSPAVITPRLNANATTFTPKLVPSPSTSQPPSRPPPSSSPFTFNAPPPPVPATSTPFTFPSTWQGSSNTPTTTKSEAPPVLPRIDTTSLSNPPREPRLATPKEPPPLRRHQPISLPGTPSASFHLPPTPLTNLKINLLAPSSSGPSYETQASILSPISLQTPTLSRNPTINFSPPNGKLKFSAAELAFPTVTKDKGKSPERPPLDEAEVEKKVTRFLQRSHLVKSTFRQWHQLVLKRVAWHEACQQSETYSQKVKRQRHSLGASSSNKRRISLGPATPVDASQRKRARRRISSTYHPPRTDEELAQRFKENHKEHERRWARGSFLKVVRNDIETRLGGAGVHPSWRLWLSMNPESDATAIWMERKFDVPASGDWVSEAIFSIPFLGRKDPVGELDSPGLVVFENTPLGGITDELERKFRILEDCARLRDIVKVFPPKRHFVTCLLVISWIEEEEQTKASSDFVDMVQKLVDDHTLQSCHSLSITAATKDLDAHLLEALRLLPLDLEGKLVRSLTLRGIFKLFEPSFSAFIAEWIDNCSVNGYFDWHLFGQVVQAAVVLLNDAASSVGALVSKNISDLLPGFSGVDVADNESAYESIATWLSNIGVKSSKENIILNIQSHRNVGQAFPARTFLDHLWELVQSQTEARLSGDHSPPQAKFYIPNADISAGVAVHQRAYEPHQKSLGQTLHLSVRRSPKRSASVDTEAMTRSQSKRPRLSSPSESLLGFSEADELLSARGASPPYLNGRSTASPTPTMTSLDPSEGLVAGSVVTAAMLRSLARDMKKKYGGGGQ